MGNLTYNFVTEQSLAHVGALNSSLYNNVSIMIAANGTNGSEDGNGYSYYESLSDEEFKRLLLEYISPKFYHWIFIVLFFIVFVVGISGNLMVCYSVWRSTQLKTVTNYFLANLAAADFLVLLVCLPPSVIQDVTQSWFLGAALCKLFVYLQRVSVFVSVLTLTTISVERYLAICRPLTYRRTTFKTRVALAVIWTIALVTPIQEFFTIDLRHDDQVRESLRPLLSSCGPVNEKVELEFTLFLIGAFYLLPLFVMTFTYANIARCLWTSTTNDSAVSENLQYNYGGEQLRTRRRTAKMLIVVVVVFGLCYLPIYIFEIARYLKLTDWLNTNHLALYAIVWTSRWLCYFNSAVNPLIYNFMSRRFRRQFKGACVNCYMSLKCCFGRHREDAIRYSKDTAVKGVNSLIPDMPPKESIFEFSISRLRSSERTKSGSHGSGKTASQRTRARYDSRRDTLMMFL